MARLLGALLCMAVAALCRSTGAKRQEVTTLCCSNKVARHKVVTSWRSTFIWLEFVTKAAVLADRPSLVFDANGYLNDL